MSIDIFEFWSSVPADTKVHPADAPVFDRTKTASSSGHGFDLSCLPHQFAGPLRTAPVVLLYLSPGLGPEDVEEAVNPDAQRRQARQRQGDAPLPGKEEYPAAWKWWASRTKRFGDLNQFRDKIAFLNIGAYHSVDFQDYAMLSALPSCRASIDWAQTVLFPQGESGERVIVCLRSPQFWGLGKCRKYGKALFVPPVGRSGHMLCQGENLPICEEVVAAVRAKFGTNAH